MKRVALMVGVDRYEDGAFRDLRYSVADAAALAAAFGRHGFETHVATNPGTSELLKEVKRRTAGLGAGDVFLFFFAGHGFTGPGGEHLLICSDAELAFLRHNRAGVPVDLLEELTNGKGFHRAFLLDACRTDVFSGREARGAATRDLGLVSLPDARKNPGTCCVVRSCDRFCPALEYEDLGHGVFTRAILDLLAEPGGRTLRMGEEFVGGLREKMAALLHAGDSQNPHFDSNGASFGLFAERAEADGTSRTGDVEALLAEMARLRADVERMKGAGAVAGPGIHPAKTTDIGRAEPRERQAGETKTIVLPGGAEMALVWCPPGSFLMGSPANEWRSDDETQHRVTLTKGFWMARTPVTQRQWKSVMGNNPSYFKRWFKGDDLPVEMVSWYDAQEFCLKAGPGLALPTEAQWEYACRAGTTGPYAGTGRLEDMGWYRDNSGDRTHPVGTKQPNAWGLCDMHGNVWEWCADWYGQYPRGAVTDPPGAQEGSNRVLRGGSWGNGAGYCRSANRDWSEPDLRHDRLGLRVALLPVQ